MYCLSFIAWVCRIIVFLYIIFYVHSGVKCSPVTLALSRGGLVVGWGVALYTRVGGNKSMFV